MNNFRGLSQWRDVLLVWSSEYKLDFPNKDSSGLQLHTWRLPDCLFCVYVYIESIHSMCCLYWHGVESSGQVSDASARQGDQPATLWSPPYPSETWTLTPVLRKLQYAAFYLFPNDLHEHIGSIILGLSFSITDRLFGGIIFDLRFIFTF